MIKSSADGKIEDTSLLTKTRMEKVDDETVADTLDFIYREHKAGKPFYVWWNGTRMHYWTHVKAELRAFQVRTNTAKNGMVEHDMHSGQLPAKLDESGITATPFCIIRPITIRISTPFS